MSTTTPFAPFETRHELARGKRRTIVYLVIAVLAVVLSVVASRTTDNVNLVVVYLVAAAMHLASSLAAAVRWSRTSAFPDEQ
jgi:CHASE2 domain-containing sensor protein